MSAQYNEIQELLRGHAIGRQNSRMNVNDIREPESRKSVPADEGSRRIPFTPSSYFPL